MVYSRSRDLTELLRSAESESFQRDVIFRMLGVDHLSRDDDIRRAAILAAAGHGGYGLRDDFTLDDLIRADDIRRINVCAQLANSNVRVRDLNAEVHPKMNTQGRFMKAFDIPKRMEQLLTMDSKYFPITYYKADLHPKEDILDRLLRFYDLAPDSSRRLNLTSSLRGGISLLSSFTSGLSGSDRDTKMICLLEFLGVDINDVGLDLRRDRYLSTAGLLTSSSSLLNPSNSLLNNNSSSLLSTSSLLNPNNSLLNGLTNTNSLLSQNSLLHPSSSSSLLNPTNSLLRTSNLLSPNSTLSSSLLNPSRNTLTSSHPLLNGTSSLTGSLSGSGSLNTLFPSPAELAYRVQKEGIDRFEAQERRWKNGGGGI